MSERAYFTPTRDEISEIQRHLLDVPSAVSIQFNTLGSLDANQAELPEIFEHTMKVKQLLISAAGYAIYGTVKCEDGDVIAKLEVDITVEPPVATYSILGEV
ncbi:hypothetical protein H6801_04215 [Candidatus Nomurabacteria bacterium]|nr:hypothetical protein [Candidatus Nomurabacteria bacterium]